MRAGTHTSPYPFVRTATHTGGGEGHRTVRVPQPLRPAHRPAGGGRGRGGGVGGRARVEAGSDVTAGGPPAPRPPAPRPHAMAYVHFPFWCDSRPWSALVSPGRQIVGHRWGHANRRMSICHSLQYTSKPFSLLLTFFCHVQPLLATFSHFWLLLGGFWSFCPLNRRSRLNVHVNITSAADKLQVRL